MDVQALIIWLIGGHTTPGVYPRLGFVLWRQARQLTCQIRVRRYSFLGPDRSAGLDARKPRLSFHARAGAFTLLHA